MQIEHMAQIAMENRELRQRLDTALALADQTLDQLKSAYRGIVAAELAIKRWRKA